MSNAHPVNISYDSVMIACKEYTFLEVVHNFLKTEINVFLEMPHYEHESCSLRFVVPSSNKLLLSF